MIKKYLDIEDSQNINSVSENIPRYFPSDGRWGGKIQMLDNSFYLSKSVKINNRLLFVYPNVDLDSLKVGDFVIFIIADYKITNMYKQN